MEICVALGAPLFYAPANGFARSFFHSRLPMDALADSLRARWPEHGLPLSSDLFGLLS